MTFEHYINQPMQPGELKINMINAKNPRLTISPKRYINNSLIIKYFHISVKN